MARQQEPKSFPSAVRKLVTVSVFRFFSEKRGQVVITANDLQRSKQLIFTANVIYVESYNNCCSFAFHFLSLAKKKCLIQFGDPRANIAEKFLRSSVTCVAGKIARLCYINNNF